MSVFREWVNYETLTNYKVRHIDKPENWLQEIIVNNEVNISYDGVNLYYHTDLITPQWLARDVNKSVSNCERALFGCLSELAGSTIQGVAPCPKFGRLDKTLVKVDDDYFKKFVKIPNEFVDGALPIISTKRSEDFERNKALLERFFQYVDSACHLELGTFTSALQFTELHEKRQEIFQLIGKGGNGKGTIASIIARLFEHDAYIANSFPNQSGHAELKWLNENSDRKVIYFEDLPNFNRSEFEKIKGWSTAQHVDVKNGDNIMTKKFIPVFWLDVNFAPVQFNENSIKRRLVKFDFGETLLTDYFSEDEIGILWSIPRADIIATLSDFDYDYSLLEKAKNKNNENVIPDEVAEFIQVFGNSEYVEVAKFRQWLQSTKFERRLVESWVRGADKQIGEKRVRVFENKLFKKGEKKWKQK